MTVSGEHMKKMVGSDQLSLEDGEINLFDFRMGMLPAFTLRVLIEKLYDRHGEEVFDILREVGKQHGQYAIDEIGKKHDIPRKQFLEQALYTADVLGLGEFSLERQSCEKGEIVFRLDNSPFKEEFEKSDQLSGLDRGIDDLQMGMCQAVSEAVLDGEVEAEEVSCTFQGDDCCRFVIKRK